jgi:hypothetical protein
MNLTFKDPNSGTDYDVKLERMKANEAKNLSEAAEFQVNVEYLRS